jgi:hypothetical protein
MAVRLAAMLVVSTLLVVVDRSYALLTPCSALTNSTNVMMNHFNALHPGTSRSDDPWMTSLTLFIGAFTTSSSQPPGNHEQNMSQSSEDRPLCAMVPSTTQASTVGHMGSGFGAAGNWFTDAAF